MKKLLYSSFFASNCHLGHIWEKKKNCKEVLKNVMYFALLLVGWVVAYVILVSSQVQVQVLTKIMALSKNWRSLRGHRGLNFGFLDFC